MKILISYFYQIRFFKKNMIPVSTAIWDPKWFHMSKGNSYVYKDKNGVYNGFRYDLFAPKSSNCSGPTACSEVGKDCQFLQDYRNQLDGLDFSKVYSDLTKFGNRIKEIEKFEEDPIVVLIVYETPDNPCSERKAIREWFGDHGVSVEEFSK